MINIQGHQTFQVPSMEESSPMSLCKLCGYGLCKGKPSPKTAGYKVQETLHFRYLKLLMTRCRWNMAWIRGTARICDPKKLVPVRVQPYHVASVYDIFTYMKPINIYHSCRLSNISYHGFVWDVMFVYSQST